MTNKKPPAERVRLAARKFGKFGLTKEQVEAALVRIDSWRKEHERYKEHTTVMTKKQRHHLQMFANAANKMLYYSKIDLPPMFKAIFWAGEWPNNLSKLIEGCSLQLSQKQKPRRDDGFEKHAAIEAACELLAPSQRLSKDHCELAAILYGTGRTADVARAFRTHYEEAVRLIHAWLDDKFSGEDLTPTEREKMYKAYRITLIAEAHRQAEKKARSRGQKTT